ncbi:cytochrome c biogenesis protein CcsA [Bacteroides faecalis]|uniref:Cytochrome c biogenesis protein n=1 Tax=Bacteroides faecalis TaxID=2447885 RepID=A0A401LUU5_9BACE|nr:cytochrome c biogenesis protein CcsA [Bacteroides faecalis]GCB35274.1 cytochrome c biogenesis protein [Bacteroides faecalis]
MKLIRLIASPVLMYVLAALYAVILAIATFVENSYGPAVAREYFYYAPWFILLQLLQAINLLSMFLQGSYFKRINKGSLFFHGAFIFMWLGAAASHYVGVTGIVHIREGETVNYMMRDDGAGTGNTSLPFSVKLNDFRLERYPGSHSPMSYESDLVIKQENEPSFTATVRMNKVIEVNGYRLFQSSFDRDELGTVLSVSYDRPGMQLTYTGYFLLFVGFVLTLFSKNSRFGRLRKELSAMKKNVPFCLLLLLGLSGGIFGTQTLRAQSPTVSSLHAEKFGQLVVLNPNGRLEPVNSYTSAILRKLYGAEKMNGLTSDQFFLNLLSFPEEWGKVPFIKVDNKEILKRFGRDGKYMAWQDVFDKNGNYVLADEVNAIYSKSAAERKRLDSDLLKLDESVNIIYQIMQRQLLPLFPDENDVRGKWYSAGDSLNVFQGKDSMFVSKIMDWYLYELNNGVRSNDWKEADKVVDMIQIFQQAKSKTPVIDNQKIKAELLYNQLDLFLGCRLAYLILGGILLFIACGEMMTDFKWGRKLNIPLITLLVIAFLAHTTGVLLRWYISGHAPWANAYESMVCTSWMLVGCGLLFARRFPILPALAGLLGGIMLFVAGLNHLNPEITPLVPVLQSYWLMSHVAIIMIGYVFFALCALTGLFNLILMSLLSTANQLRLRFRIRELTLLNEMAMILGLFFMTAGTFLGAIWANVSWGRYWGWDPKETWALISIVIYALVLHLRFVPLLKGKTDWCFNLLSVVSILSVLMTWFGVNYYLSGLHSYGKTEGSGGGLWIWGIGLCIVLALSMLARKRFRQNS